MSFVGRRRRSFWRSLRWRLTAWYVALLAVILTVLGVILLALVSQLLLTNATQRFAQEAVTAALTRRAAYDNEVIRHDAAGKCVTPTPAYANAFQTMVVDPLTQAPARLGTVALLDYQTGETIAPLASNGPPPPEFQAAMLARLTQKVGMKPANWRAVVALRSQFYQVTEDGTPVAVALIAYEYRIPVSCVAGKAVYFQYPAVLLIAQSLAATQATQHTFALTLALSVGGIFLLGFAIGVPVTGVQLRRLSRITLAARQIAAGDLHQRVGLPPRGDEIGELAQHFDEMAANTEEAFARQHASEARVRQFIADASHELRTPLTSVRGYLDVLARHPVSQDADVQHNLTAARQEAERMSRIVTDLLTLARFDTGRPLDLTQIDLGEVAGEAVDQARLVAGTRQVTLAGDGGGKLLALADRDRIKQVLLVLLDNALKYGRRDASALVALRLRRTPEAAIITVTDNGPGIHAEDLPHIFERFFRAPNASPSDDDAASNGSGLGLAIARAIVGAHNGTITVASTPDAGTTFTFTLPMGG